MAIFFLPFAMALPSATSFHLKQRHVASPCIVCRFCSATLDSEKAGQCRSKPPQELQKMLPPQLFASLFPNHKATE
ncbi:MAG: hypothetical protein U0793_29185 [Gemmataceae bacterium]